MSELWKDAFDSVHAEEQLKRHTKEYLRKKVYAPRRMRRPLYGGIAAAVLCLMVIVFSGGYYMYTTPAAYIRMDGDMSVELSINRFGQVVGARGFDRSGNALAGVSDVVHMDYGDAVAKLIGDGEAAGDLETGELTLTVSGEDEAWCREILEAVAADTSAYDNIQYQLGDDVTADDGSIQDGQSVDTTDFIQESGGDSVQTPQGHHSEGEGHNHRYGE